MQVGTHEAVCAERYHGILKSASEMSASMEKMQAWAVKIGVLLIAGMAGILTKLVFFAHA